MKKLLYISIIAVLLLGCEKQTLDALAFPSVALDAYEFEQYEDPEIEIDQAYKDGLTYHLVPLTSVDEATGETFTIYGLYFGDTTQIAADTVIYYCHGQARHMDYYWTRAALLANLGGKHNYGVFMIDYRGYGMSEGTSSESGLSEDADAGIEWLIDRGLTEDRAFYYGFSLGAIPALERAVQKPNFTPEKVICESPLASVEYLTQSSTVINTDADFVTQLEFNNAEMIKGLDKPFFWLHGVEDDYVSIDNGEIIYGNYQGPYSQAWRVEGGNHADLPNQVGIESYLEEILQFIRL